jgi:hypothetical protein
VVFLFLAVALLFSISNKIPFPWISFIDIGTYRMPPDYLEVNRQQTIGQSFVPNFDGLFMVSVFIPRQELKKDTLLIFHLKTNKDDPRDLVTLKWKYSQISFSRHSFYIIPPDRENTAAGFHFHIQFPVIKGIKGKELYLCFESSVDRGSGLRIGVWEDAATFEGLSKGTLFINQKAMPGFLAFRTYNTWQGNLSSLMREIRINLLQDKPFFILYSSLLSIILFSVIVISQLIRKEML